MLTGITASISGEEVAPVTLIQGIEKRGTNLSVIEQVNQISRRYCGAEIELIDAYEELKRVESVPYPPLLAFFIPLVVAVGFTISFGGSFFALVDTTKIGITEISPKTVPDITKLGMKMLDVINKEIPVKHPLLDIDTVDLVEFYGPTPNPDKATMRNVVIFGDAMADRSPCGTGTSAKLATLHHWGEIGVGEEFIYESFIGTRFKGVIKETTKVADYDAVIPMITGSCYLTGVATYLIDPTDPLKYGFQVG